MICDSPTVRLVNHCFTTRTSRRSRTCRPPLFHDPYEANESYGSWTCIYTASLSNDMRFTNCTTRIPLFHDPYESNESYGKEDAIIRVVSIQFVYIGQPSNRIAPRKNHSIFLTTSVCVCVCVCVCVGGGGGTAVCKVSDARRLGYKSRILVSLRVLITKPRHFSRQRIL